MLGKCWLSDLTKFGNQKTYFKSRYVIHIANDFVPNICSQAVVGLISRCRIVYNVYVTDHVADQMVSSLLVIPIVAKKFLF